MDPAKHPAEWGDVYTFVALDAVSKLVVGFYVGKRNEEGAEAFIADLRARLTVVPQLSTDGRRDHQGPLQHLRRGQYRVFCVMKKR